MIGLKYHLDLGVLIVNNKYRGYLPPRFNEAKDLKKKKLREGKLALHRNYGYRSIGIGAIGNKAYGYKSFGIQLWNYTIAWDVND